MRSTRTIALCLSLCLLASCATHSSPAPDLTVAPAQVHPQDCVKPSAEPRLPDGAGIERPSSDASKAATAAFLGWVDEVLQWGRGMAAEQAKRAGDCA